jgi:hypothetical protein
MEHEPCRLLRDADVPRNLARADTVLAVDEQPERGQPLVQAERRILKDRPGLQRELWAGMLHVALPAAHAGEPDHMLGATDRTRHLAVRPAEFREKLAAVLEISEVEDGVLERLRQRRLHAL